MVLPCHRVSSLFLVLLGHRTLEIAYVLGQVLREVLALQDDPPLIVIASRLLSLLKKLIVFVLCCGVWRLPGQTSASLRHIVVIVARQVLGHGLDWGVKADDIVVIGVVVVVLLDARVFGLVVVDFLVLPGRHSGQRCSLLAVQFCILEHTFVTIRLCDASLWTLRIQDKHTLKLSFLLSGRLFL